MTDFVLVSLEVHPEQVNASDVLQVEQENLTSISLPPDGNRHDRQRVLC